MIRNNKNKVIPIAVLAMILPAVGMLGINTSEATIETNEVGYEVHIPTDVDTTKLLSITESDYRIFTFPEMIERSDAIVIGTFNNANSFAETNTNDRFPAIFTKFDLQVDEVLKGSPATKNYDVQTWGGETLERVQIMTDRMELKNNQQVLVFLEKNPESETFGNNYYPVSEKYGILQVVGDSLYQHGEERPIPLDEFKKAIQMELNQ